MQKHERLSRPLCIRGAALVETMLSMILLLGLLFGGAQVALIGYYQLALEQGTEIQAHTTAMGVNSQTANSYLHKYLPILGDRQFTLGTAASHMSLPFTGAPSGDFNLTDPNNRTGGFTVTAPLPQLSTISTNSGQSFLNIGNFPIHLAAAAVEGNILELCPHYCLRTGGLGSAQLSDAVDYFAYGDNTPPYFFTYNFMRTCHTAAGWNLAAYFYWSNECRNMNTNLEEFTWRALGSAAHLDSTNYQYLGRGEELSPTYTGLQYAAPVVDGKTGPFFEVWCHRNMYAWIEHIAFPGHPNEPNSVIYDPTAQDTPGWLVEPGGTYRVDWGETYSIPLEWLFWPAAFTQSSMNVPNGYVPPGAVIYQDIDHNTDEVGQAGWDTQVAASPTLGVNFSPTLRPWIGCGQIPGGN
jgi:hypothetical protein